MPGGRPKLYQTEEERDAARKRQNRDNLRAFRQRQALQRKTDVVKRPVPRSSFDIVIVKPSRTRGKQQSDIPSQRIAQIHDDEGYDTETRRLADKDSPPQVHTGFSPSGSVPAIVDSLLEGNYHERRSFYYFRLQSVKELVGGFNSEFWQRSLLQACHAEPAVKHAVLALASLHEGFSYSDRFAGRVRSLPSELLAGEGQGDDEILIDAVTWNNFGLIQYSRAVQLISNGLNTQERSPSSRREIIMICCTLFIFVEILLGNVHGALIHIQHGIRILQEHQKENKRELKSRGRVSPTPAFQHYISTTDLLTIFTTLDCCAKTWLFTMPKSTYEYAHVDRLFEASSDTTQYECIEDAKRRVEEISCIHFSILHSIQAVAPGHDLKSPPHGSTSALCAMIAAHDLKLDAFVTAQEKAGKVDMSLRLCILTLRVQVLACKITAPTFAIHEPLPPTSDANLIALVNMAETVISLQHLLLDSSSLSSSAARPSFGASLGITPALFAPALMCTDAAVREKALALLRLSRRKDCFWDSRMAYDLMVRKQKLWARGEPMRLDEVVEVSASVAAAYQVDVA